MGLFTSGNAYSHMIVGLGNPGQKYENTRHNAGFTTIDRLAQTKNVPINKLKYKALLGDCVIAGKKTLLLKPQTFMNSSGEAVRDAAAFYKIPAENIIVIFDDISLDVGKMRIRLKGSDGGQRGMRSIIELTGTSAYPRIKMGIGAKPNPNWDLADWVLSKFTEEKQKLLYAAADNACRASELIIAGESAKAMNLYNS